MADSKVKWDELPCDGSHGQERTGSPSQISLVLARWAGWSGVQVGRYVSVEAGQTTYPVNRGRVREGWRGEMGAREKVTKRTRGKEGVELGRGHRGP